MLKRVHPWGLGVVGIAFLSNLVVHAYLGSYSRFIADDYCSAGIAERFGVLRAVWYWYLNWTGRYSASALDAVFGLLGPRVTPVVTAIVLLVWVAVLSHTAGTFISRDSKSSWFSSVLLALTVLFLTLGLSPNIPQALYWGQGMRSLVPPLILSAAYADALAWYGRRQWKPATHALWLLVAFLLPLIAGGLNETFAALQASALLFALILTLLVSRTDPRRGAVHVLIAGTLGAALAVVLVIIAPGNAFRQAFYPAPPGLLGMLGIAIPNFLAFLPRTFSFPERLMAALAGVCASAFLGTLAAPIKRRLWLAPLILVLGLLFAFLCFLPSAYGLSDTPPERTLLIPSHIIALALVLASFVLANQLALSAAGGERRLGLEAGLLVLALILSVTSAALSDSELLSKREAYAAYAAHWDEVNAQIVAARDAGSNQVLISVMNNWAGLNEPNDNPKFWVNACYRQYYGIQVLAADQ